MVLGLESVVFQQDLLGCGWKDLQPMGTTEMLRSFVYGGFGENECDDGVEIFGMNTANWGYSSQNSATIDLASFPEDDCGFNKGSFYGGGSYSVEAPAAKRGQRKRRRAKIVKNSEEIENQRMTHIAVERNRRKQMNEYLSMLRSMMPSSYTQRGDQASIVGGTINFVKELEQLLQCLEAEKQTQEATDSTQHIFTNFISSGEGHDSVKECVAERVNVEVTVMESYANIKMMAENRPKQLLKVVAELHSLHLLILHINVTTVRQMVLYCFSVKIEDDCKLSAASEITAAVNEIFGRIHMEKKLISSTKC